MDRPTEKKKKKKGKKKKQKKKKQLLHGATPASSPSSSFSHSSLFSFLTNDVSAWYPFTVWNSRISPVQPVQLVFFPVRNKGLSVLVNWLEWYIPAVPAGTIWNWLPWNKECLIILQIKEKIIILIVWSFNASFLKFEVVTIKMIYRTHTNPACGLKVIIG